MTPTSGGTTKPVPSAAEVVARYPRGAIDHDNIAQWRGFLDRQLLVNRCDDCGRWSNPPRAICPACWSGRVGPRAISGRGRVQWFTLLFQGGPPDSLVHPYPVVVVELDEQAGLRVTSTLVDCDPASIACDMPVELRWDERGGAPIPVFGPPPGVPASPRAPSTPPVGR